MKTIIITRHAKSSWESIYQSDFERPLNERGLRDAPFMGEKLAKYNLGIQAIISSTAVRALQTSNLIAPKIGINTVITIDELYHAAPYVIDACITTLPPELNTVLLVCHNPGITAWVLQHSTANIYNMPTCGMVGVKATVDTWIDFCTATKELLFVEYPKKHGLM